MANTNEQKENYGGNRRTLLVQLPVGSGVRGNRQDEAMGARLQRQATGVENRPLCEDLKDKSR